MLNNKGLTDFTNLFLPNIFNNLKLKSWDSHPLLLTSIKHLSQFFLLKLESSQFLLCFDEDILKISIENRYKIVMMKKSIVLNAKMIENHAFSIKHGFFLLFVINMVAMMIKFSRRKNLLKHRKSMV